MERGFIQVPTILWYACVNLTVVCTLLKLGFLFLLIVTSYTYFS
jgi:hypothetical protein